MNSVSYLNLNAWLQKADQNYIGGRSLWLQSFIGGACILLWLASEQIMKILWFQDQVESFVQSYPSLDELYEKLDGEGKKLGHNVGKLIQKIKPLIPEIDRFDNILSKLNEYFQRRYCVRKDSSIRMNMLNDVDEFYFLIRSKILPEVGIGTIDEIHIRRKYNLRHPVNIHEYAYLKNNYFQPRKHSEINFRLANGVLITESGT